MVRILRNSALFTLLLFSCVSGAFAQDTTQADTVTVAKLWDWGGTGTINFSQVSLHNWSAGGQNSLSVLGIANVFANYKSGKNTINNTLNVTYGTVKLENQRVRKSDDRVDLNLKYGRQASDDWFYTAQLNLRTQLTPTYNEERTAKQSDFFSPAFILASIGMDYKPNEKLSVFLSPFTGKFTIVADQELADRGTFGVDRAQTDAAGNPIAGTGKRFRGEFGSFANIRYKDEIWKNVTWQSKLDLFTNYLNNPENVDINFENMLNLKVNDYLSTSFFLHMVYDDDIMIDVDESGDGVIDARGPRLQLKETFGVGLSYKFR
ncbi:DUF3078 domain-containing protein [Pontibacter harenae]|uniref:DUF3078 domain-containing protein n=1 Tax=Pontibacter harenae TaxID=2894083 RepID=UPI001E4CED61|nr:DUF3078 domain-containing protein [Pontibacter harenae]MCC9166182.1 DUF3078 domain-containing protein [Pontibacter harenae]